MTPPLLISLLLAIAFSAGVACEHILSWRGIKSSALYHGLTFNKGRKVQAHCSQDCPFCSSRETGSQHDRDRAWVLCMDCGLRGPRRPIRDSISEAIDEAVTTWNRISFGSGKDPL